MIDDNDTTDEAEDDPFESEPQAHEQEDQGAASAAPASAPANAMQTVINAAPAHAGKFAYIAMRYNVKEDDPAWLLALAVLDTSAAAEQAVGAADRIDKSTAGVGDVIYKQTMQAGNELQDVIRTALAAEVIKTGKALLQAIKLAADAGAQKIEVAAAGIDDAARAQQTVIVRRMHADFAQAARSATKSQYARSWLGIALTLLFTLAIGSGIGIEAQYLDGKVLPWGWHVATPGARDCGTITTLRGTGQACVATHD